MHKQSHRWTCICPVCTHAFLHTLHANDFDPEARFHLAKAVCASQAVTSSTMSLLSQLTQSHHKVFALRYMCAVVLCTEVTGSVAAGAWAQGSSEIQLASGCRMKTVI